MTLNDLKDEMSALGFEQEINVDDNLVFAVRRALSTIYTERSVYNAFFIEHHPIMPTLVCNFLVHTPLQTESFTLSGRAYSFTASGSGTFTVNDGGTVTEHSFSAPLYLWRGFINGEATITFSGDFSFEVFNLAVFESVRSSREEDIFAYGEPFEYRISEIRNDFHSFISLPTDACGKEINGIVLESDKLIIPWGYKGRINVIYKVRAPEITIDEPDREIDIPRETEHLVALLASAYYWVDDAPDKAEYYLSLYRDAMKSVKLFNTRRLGGGYNNVTGWA